MEMIIFLDWGLASLLPHYKRSNRDIHVTSWIRSYAKYLNVAVMQQQVFLQYTDTNHDVYYFKIYPIHLDITYPVRVKFSHFVFISAIFSLTTHGAQPYAQVLGM